MRNEEFEQMLKRTLHQTPSMVNSGHLEQTCLLAEKEMYRQHLCERISFTRFLSMQMRYVGWKIWTVQGVLLLLVSMILARTYGQYFLERPQSVARLLFCLSVFVSMTALPFIYRSIRYQMQEVEAATYFSSVKLLMARLAVIGIGDIFILAGICILTIVKTPLLAGNAILNLCFPFLLVVSGCLFMLGHFNPKHFFVGSLVFCSVLVLGCAVIPGRYEALFQQTFTVGWMGICALLILFCTQQFQYILYRSSYTEMQIVT